MEEQDSWNYTIPENINKLIDKEFLALFKKSLDEAYPVHKDGCTYFLDEGHYRLSEGSGHWSSAMLSTCFDLHKLEIIGYYETLEWWESDIFDDELCSKLIKELL